MAARALLALAGLLALTAQAHASTGWGTAYSGDGEKDATGRNACDFGDLGSYFEDYYAALPLNSWDSSSCGRCLRARGLQSGASGDWVVVKVVDQCAGCRGGDVDFSSSALKAITGFSWDMKRIEWEWTDCSEASSDGSRASVSAASEDASSPPPSKKKRHHRHRHNSNRRLRA